MDKLHLSYEDFGAVGDGKHDDFDAIIACHEEANRTGKPVKTNDNATYYIGGKDATAVIKTDVDFGKSKFIIDDRNLERITSYVFTVDSDFETYKIELSPISKGQKKIDIPHEGNLFVKIYDDTTKIFIRKGLNMNNGTSKVDIFVLDEDGNVYPSIDWDYPVITRAEARRIDDEPITIKGGIFTTIANQAESFYNYHQRGFNIKRAHVTMCDFEHYVEGELDHGAPYHGFIRTHLAVDVTIRDAIITPRFIYQTASKIPGRSVAMGSYDLSFWSSIDVRCINVKQTVDITDTRYWGIYTSNFCKNLFLDNCVFSRFDAHQGVTNATIRNCTLGHQHIQLIGHGEFLIENSTIISNGCNFIYLRCDYGSIWDGNITIRNCKYKTNAKTVRIIGENNVGDHDYGYRCVMGNNITVDGFELLCGADRPKDDLTFSILSNANGANPEMPYAYNTPTTLTLSNVTAENGKEYVISQAPQNFKNLTVNGKKYEET